MGKQLFKPNPNLTASTREGNHRRSVAWRERHREEERIRARNTKRRKRLDPAFREKQRIGQKKRYWDNPEARRLEQRRRTKMLKIEVIAHYGGKCTCCGETRIEFLALNHKNGDGLEQRRRNGFGTAFYQYVRKEWPTDLNVLCHNCNVSLGMYGYCPHTINEIGTGTPIILNPTGG